MKLSEFVFGSIPLLIQLYADKYQKDDLDKTLKELESDVNLPRINNYDFIVAGSGTAGSLVAGKLAKHFQVLLLEQGGPPVPATTTPFLRGNVFTHTAINNVFKSSTYSPETGEMANIFTGRMLGGSGSHNGNLFNRGSPHDYDMWATLTGDDSWSYKHILKHFKNLESFAGKLVNESQREEYYGNSGKLDVESDWPPHITAWFNAANELGFRSDDPNGYQTESFTTCMKSMKNGEKASTYTAFVKPLEYLRSSLTVVPYSTVEQILIKNKTAYGVIYKRHGMAQIAHASKEVIISCGAIQSPMLLIKSGIGPKKVLDEAKIPTHATLDGVGKNAVDHIEMGFRFEAKKPNQTLFPNLDESKIEEELEKYHCHNRSGYYTRKDVASQAFIVSSRAKNEGEKNWPDLQIVLFPNQVFGETPLTFIVALNRPKSFGHVLFNTSAYILGKTSDLELAVIDHNLFNASSDIDVMLEGIRLMYKIVENTTSFKSLELVSAETQPEACKSITFGTDEYWKCYIQQRAEPGAHLCGTCKMGKSGDPMAVVDSKLRVRGIDKLRVVDSSVFPIITNANINAAVMLVAEKAAHEILTKWKTSQIDNL